MKTPIYRISVSFLAILCLLVGMPVAFAAPDSMLPFSLATISADLSRSGTDLYKYGRVDVGKVEKVTYTVVLQQKGIWPWSSYSDYEYYSGSSTTGSATYGSATSPPTGYHYRVVVYASSPSFPHLEATSNAIYY